MDEERNRAEAQRCIEIAEKLLTARDLIGSKKFAVRAQGVDPLLDGIDQILAIADVLLASEKRINNHLDWYAILQLDSQSDDLELIRRNYRRLASLLHPDKNKRVFATNAFKLVADAWTVLSNPSKKSLYDKELNLFSIASKNEQPREQHCHQRKQPERHEEGEIEVEEHPVRRSPRNKKRKSPREPKSTSFNEGRPALSPLLTTFWTACPYCYNLYEYPKVYYCCWGFFPLGFSLPNLDSTKNASFPNWMPFSPMVAPPAQPSEGKRNKRAPNTSLGVEDVSDECDLSPDTNIRKKGRTADVKEKASTIKKPGGLRTDNANRGNDYSSGPMRKDCQGSQDGNVARRGKQTEVPKVASPQKKRKKKMVAKKTKKQMRKSSPSKKVERKSPQETEKGDLNEELRNEVEKSTPATGESTDTGTKDEDPGVGFFEGLDDIIGSLPILSVVEDNKVDGAGV
uniref:J domain-containing protein n=1 Tax=Nelumbo nucifera TaxID=4432 RepID=A0A822XSN3_NELNU|nr:TPA_asm: hypothetical protein HUJ06_023562 [Nelumbo nucifera]